MKSNYKVNIWVMMLILSSCGATRPYYKNNDNIGEAYQGKAIPQDQIDYELYMVGDVGVDDTGLSQSYIVNEIKSQLRSDSKNQSVIFLGNTFGKRGLPEKDSHAYNKIDAAIEDCIIQFKENTDKLYFLPGSNEWNDGEQYTTEAVNAVEDYLQSKVDKKNIFAPSKGCGEPKVVELTDDLIIVLVDSQWVLQGDANNERTRSSCKVDTQIELIAELKEILSDYKSKNVIIAAHHPVYTNGITGGNYGPIHHLLPLPILGSLITGIKKIGGGEQKFGHPQYETYRKTMNLALGNYEGVIVCSAHDHNMQYIPKDDNHYVIAGSGSDVDYVRKGGYAEFAAMEKGFSKIIHTKDLELWIEFYKVNPKDKTQPKLIFQKLLYKKEIIDYKNKNIYKDADDYPESKSTVASRIYAQGKFGMGETYRTEWGTEVDAPLLILSEVGGGVVPVQQGGGFQTKSLRLENEEGQQWVVRTIDKDVTKVVPIEFRSTLVQDLMQDGISAAHPYAAFAIPKLAEAAKIYHANPKFVWLPKQKVLGDYNNDFAERLYLFEERPGGNMENHPTYGGAVESINTLELVEKLTDNHRAKVDQEYVLRARLFDMLIGDWDRHDDQWRWGEFDDPDSKKGKIYKAIPRDRDQVFFKNDGFINYIASRPFISPGLRKFDYEVDFIAGLNFNARHFDRHFLSQLNEEVFISIAQELQKDITDSVMQNALNDWPPQIYNISGEEILSKLKQRRADLVIYAQEFYHYLTKEVTVVGTDGNNTFDIVAMPDNKLDVKAYHEHDDDNKLIWNRIINGNDCDELRIYGLKKDDIFNFSGDARSSIKIKLVGGGGDDIINNESQFLSITAYDKKDGMAIEGNSVKAKLSNRRGINKFNRKDWKLDRSIHFPLPTFYTDEGIGINYNLWWIKNGFRKDPYKGSHKLSLGYFWANNAIVSKYTGHWPGVMGPLWDLRVDAVATGPTFTQFFYGLTNEYINYENVFPNEEEAGRASFHIVRGTHIDFNPVFDKLYRNNRVLSINPSIEYWNLDERVNGDENRFIFQEEAGRSIEDFGSKVYAAIGLNYTSDRVNNPGLPTRGYRLNVNVDYKYSLSNSDFSNLTFSSNVSSYIPFSPTHRFVIATNIGGAYTIGDAEFFHANYLSNQSRLRGYRINRFGGEGIVYHATDFRLKIFQGNGGLKTGIGLFGSFDYGRAFVNSENVNDWHTSYGGGVYLSPLNLIGFKIGYYKGEDDNQISVGGALSF